MHGLACLVPVLLLAACDPPPPTATLTEVPAKFVGRWDRTLEECRTGGPLSVRVTASEVMFPDSRIAVTGVAPDGANAARVDGHFASEVAEWDGSVRLELADGGKELNVVNGTPVSPRMKCP